MPVEPATVEPVPSTDDLSAIEDLIGTAGRAVAWMHHALSIEVGARRATREFAAGELERMTAIVHLLEDLRGGARVPPRLHLSFVPCRRRLKS